MSRRSSIYVIAGFATMPTILLACLSTVEQLRVLKQETLDAIGDRATMTNVFALFLFALF